jgi:hypothetical protein
MTANVSRPERARRAFEAASLPPVWSRFAHSRSAPWTEKLFRQLGDDKGARRYSIGIICLANARDTSRLRLDAWYRLR